MKISKEDPILTAYALGEIDSPAERAKIEQALRIHPELLAVVEDIRRTGDQIAEALAHESCPELGEFEKTALEQGARKRPAIARFLLSWPVATATAAALVFAFFVVSDEQRAAYKTAPPAPEGATSPTLGASSPALGANRPGAPAPVTSASNEGVEQPPNGMSANNPPIQISSSASLSEKVRVGQTPRNALRFSSSATVSGKVKVGQVGTVQLSAPSDEFNLFGAEDLSAVVHSSEAASADEVDTFVQRLPVVPPSEQTEWNRKLRLGLVAPDVVPPSGETEWNSERYDPIGESDFRSPLVAPLSTFSIDVDTASYANVRRFLKQEKLPPANAVRIEELVNYFHYDDAPPTLSLEEGGEPFAVHMAQSAAPWNSEHQLLRIALKGYEMPWDERPASNLVFLLDVSGSMESPNKLPLVKKAMRILTRRLDKRDRVAVVVYAGASGLALPSTTADNTETIEHALENLDAGGSTNAGAGIELAYATARRHFIEGGNNRVVLCTDGDFNVGVSDRGELAAIAEKQAEGGISLTVLGFGMGNYNDNMLEELSNKGKGSYAYIDSNAEARKVFLQDLAANIFKIAKDVKIQVEFNPTEVQAYRLIGYENRRLKAEDFNNDRKKAGDIGPGHSIVALYEWIPHGTEADLPAVDALRYQKTGKTSSKEGEAATVKLRYKLPEADASKLIVRRIQARDILPLEKADPDFRFCAAVAAFGLKLRASESIGSYGYAEIEQIAASALGQDSGGLRSEFVELVDVAKRLETQKSSPQGMEPALPTAEE